MSTKIIPAGNAFAALEELLVSPKTPNGDSGSSPGTEVSNDKGHGPLVRIDLPEPSIVFEKDVVEETIEDQEQDVKDDFNFARRVIRDMVRQGQQVAATATQEAAISGHPRSIEAAQMVIKMVSETAKDLMGLHKAKKEALSTIPEASQTNTTTINGNVTVLNKPQTTLEMLETMRSNGSIALLPFEVPNEPLQLEATVEGECEEIKNGEDSESVEGRTT